MPLYAYSSDTTGEYEEHFFRMGAAPRTIVSKNGNVLERDFSAEHNPRRAGGGWPLVCDASAVLPEQAQQLRELYVRAGVPTEVSKSGQPIYRDAHHRKRALKARGFHDRDSF